MDCPKCNKGKIEITTKFIEEYNTGSIKFSQCITCGYMLTPKEMENFILGIEEKYQPPLYVRMGDPKNGVALRLRGECYYRDGGDWSVGFKKIGDDWLSWHWGYGMPHLHRVKLTEITKKEWRECNGQYVTENTKAYRGIDPNELYTKTKDLPF